MCIITSSNFFFIYFLGSSNEFVSYAQVAGRGESCSDKGGGKEWSSDSELCPYYLVSGNCIQGEYCTYIHGLFCEVCQLACLHPDDLEQRKKHTEVCLIRINVL